MFYLSESDCIVPTAGSFNINRILSLEITCSDNLVDMDMREVQGTADHLLIIPIPLNVHSRYCGVYG